MPDQQAQALARAGGTTDATLRSQLVLTAQQSLMKSIREAMLRRRLKKMQRCLKYSPCKPDELTELLIVAASYDRHEAAVILLKLGARADMSMNNFGNRTPLNVVKSEKLMKLLLAHGASIEAADKDGIRPIFHAVMNGSPSVVSAFIDAGADTRTPAHYRESQYWSLMHIACHKLEIGCLAVLLQRGCEVNPVTSDGLTPFDCLLRAFWYYNYDRQNGLKLAGTKLLLQYGGKWNQHPIESLLSVIPRIPYPRQIIKLLIRWGVDPHISLSVLPRHTYYYGCAATTHLLRCGADPERRNSEQRTYFEQFVASNWSTSYKTVISHLYLMRSSDDPQYLTETMFKLFNLPPNGDAKELTEACKLWLITPRITLRPMPRSDYLTKKKLQ